MPRTYAEQCQAIVAKYRAADQPWPATSREMASWAITEGLWEPEHSVLVSECAGDLSRAMREEHITDPQGRTVRTKHAARIERDGKQSMLWADIRTAPREHMQIAFQQRRQQIVGDCRQLRADVDSFNDNRSDGASIQMSFDFTLDLEELDAADAA